MPTGQVLVGMAEIKVIKGSGQLTCLGLGSCIGLLAFDADSGVCGMAHIMLPEAFKDKPVDKPGKFADTGLPALLAEIEKAGGSTRRLTWVFAGGAQVFKYGAGTASKLDVGARNGEAVVAHLKKFGARVLAQDIGGTSGRTMIANLETGEVRVRTVQGGEKILCQLKRVRAEAA